MGLNHRSASMEFSPKGHDPVGQAPLCPHRARGTGGRVFPHGGGAGGRQLFHEQPPPPTLPMYSEEV